METLRMVKVLVVAATAVCGRLAAADPVPDKDAKARAVLYQSETVAELPRQHWRIVTNNVGRLVAHRPLPPDAPGNDPLGYASLVMTFQPKTRTDTECGVNALVYLYGNRTGSQFHKTFQGPFPYNNPVALREVNAMLAKARQRMFKAHPEYAAPATR